MKCDKRLNRKIQQLEGEPVPAGLRDKLMTDAMSAAVSARARTASPSPEQFGAQGVWKMRRVCFAAICALLMVAVGLWFLPRNNGSAALADVAQAMANVKSMHVVGWKLRSSGEKERIEIWAKEGGKFRLEDGDSEMIVDDGKKLMSVEKYEGQTSVTIRRTKDLPELEVGESYLQMFAPNQMVKWLQRDSDLGFAGSKPATLADGRKALIIELRSGPRKTLLTVDAETNLVLRLEGYGDDGVLGCLIDRFEYNMRLPDSLFNASPPRNAVVLDQRTPISEDQKKWREAMEEKLMKAGGANICKIPDGSCGSRYHPTLRFACLSREGISVYYFPKRNTYYALGRVLVFDKKSDYKRTIEDGEFRAPHASTYVPPPPPPPLTPEELKAEAMLEKSKTPGAKAVYKGIRGGGSCGSYHHGLRFRMLRDVPVLIEYLPDTNTYRITGKAEVYHPNGKTEIVENTDIEAPGPPDRE